MDERLRKVERELWAWRVVVVAAVALAVTSGAVPKTRKTLETERLVVVDEQGRKRIILDTVWPQGDAFVSVLDVRGEERASLGVMEQGLPYLTLADRAGRRRVAVDLGAADGAPQVRFYDGTGTVTDRLPR